MKKLKFINIFLFCFFIFSCAPKRVEYEYPQDPNFARKARAGRFFDKDLALYDHKNHERESRLESEPRERNEKNEINEINEKNERNKSNPLWIASLEVISDLMPIDVVDSDSGLIVTDWYQDNKNDKTRTKINLIVKDKNIAEENLALSIFKQKKDKNGIWQDQEMRDKSAAKLICEKIIEKAKIIGEK